MAVDWADPVFAESVEILADAMDGIGDRTADARRIAFALRARPEAKTMAAVEGSFNSLPGRVRREIARQGLMIARLRAVAGAPEPDPYGNPWAMSPFRSTLDAAG
ncbi:hypothetical protein [Rhodospirillum centenum]|nr:hypothetical protein [Rhodospirillum centenum]